MHTNIFSWIRKRQFTLQLFVAIMVNMMVFSQPLSYALKNQNKLNRTYFKSSTSNIESNISLNALSNDIKHYKNNITSTTRVVKSSGVVVVKDANIIPAIEKQGIIGKSENLPIDELTDNIFSFELKEDVKQEKEAYLEYELFGLADGSQATKSINDQLATGGNIIKSNKTWTKVRERLNPSDIQKGKNFVKFTTFENANYQYMVRNLKMVYEVKKNSNSETIVFNQQATNSYKGKIAFSGFVTDTSVSKVTVLDNEFPVINGVFEVAVEEKAPNANLVVSYTNSKGVKTENTIKVNQLLEEPTAVHKNNKTLAVTNKIFEKAKSNTLSFAGATIKVDEAGINDTKNISIAGLRYVDLPTLSPEMVNVTADYYGYRMLPHGNHFNIEKPAKIHLKYDEKKFPTGYTAKDVKTFYFDNEQRKWLALEKDTLLSTTQEIVSKTVHFTDFINGIIKVPESPETGSYTPTSIKDIKAADPTAGVVSIAPPSPNNMGTLNTSFPIKLPAGRSGMQPELSVNYNSEGGNGWMGLGWDLSIPGVSLDTRWGAPRYDTSIETEIYSMGGGMLTLKDGADYTNPHRKDNILRTNNLESDGSKRFYPRIEGSYAKVIRHGSNPTNYWWEVTDKTGNKSFYGGYAGAVVENSVIRTAVVDGNNIAYWGLYRTEDTNGNYVEYKYNDNQIVTLANNAPGNGGKEFYIKEIRYTRHLSEGNNLPENYYKVTFNRVSGRADVQISVRNGVVQVTKDLLDEIKVEFINNQGLIPNIRSYKFEYSDGLFFKKLLKSISEYDANGELFYSNTMEYEDKGDDKTTVITNNHFFKNSTTDNWQTPNADGVDGSLILGGLSGAISGEFSKKGSVLGTSQSNGGNGGLYVGFGLCCGGTKNLTAGVSGSYSASTSMGLISFTDINGDGLPDKVFNKNGFKFRPNTGSSFGEPINLPNNFSNISSSFSSSKSAGVQANFYAFAGYTYNTSENTTTSYLSDINGDGLVDVINEGQVFFNSTSNAGYLNNAITFSANSGVTENPISQGTISQNIINNINVKHIDELKDENPQHDIVKVWIAPKTGNINITGNVTLDPVFQSNATSFPSQIASFDGIRASVQKNQITPLWYQGIINPTFTTVQTPNPSSLSINLTNKDVQKGDRLYFRLQSRNEGNYDRVNWTPNIQYVDESTTGSNVDNISYFSSNADQGFILSNDAALIIPQTGSIAFSWPNSTTLNNIVPFQFSDDLTFIIEEVKLDNSDNVISTNAYTSIITQNSSYTGLQFTPSLPTSITYPEPNPDNIRTFFRFKVVSDSNVDWKAINWRPIVTFIPNGSTETTQYFGVVNYSIYNKKINTVISKVNLPNTNTIVIKPVFNSTVFQTSSDIANGSSHQFTLVVKNSNKRVLAKRLITIIKNNLGNITLSGTDDISINQNITGTIFIEYYTNSLAAANVGASAITAQVFQADTNLPAPSYTNPTGTCTANRLTNVNIAGIIDNNLTCPNFYENRISAVNTPNAFKGSTISVNISNFSTGFSAVWVDFNRNNSIDTSEFFNNSTASLNNIFNILIPTTALNGYTRVRIRGGNTVAFTTATFLANNISGTFRDYQINILPTTPTATTNDIYCNVGTDKFGPMYRNWGHFAYHGGIVIKRGLDLIPIPTTEAERQAPVLDVNGNPLVLYRYGEDLTGNIIPITESVLENTNNSNINQNTCSQFTYGSQEYLDCLQQNNTSSITRTRFFSLQPKPETQIYEGGEKVYVSATHFSTERFGEDDLNRLIVNLPSGSSGSSNCATDNFRAVPLINKGEGHSFSGGGSYGALGANGNYSSSFNWAELNYQDLNGDRYPDVLTRNNVQFTNNLGKLSNTSNLGFGRVTTSDSESWGAGVSGTFKVAKTPGTYATINLPFSFGGFSAISIPLSEPQVSSGSISAGAGGGSNKENLMWVDINGDGLADRLSLGTDVKVRLNLGYAISTNEEIWSIGDGDIGSISSSVNGGLGFSIANNSFSGGISASSSKSYSQKNIFDINADGLPDLVFNTNNGGLSYRINTGNGFSSTIQSQHNNNAYIAFSRSTGEGLNASFTIPIPLFLAKIAITPSFGWDKSVNREENSLNDINGDGYPDILIVPETGNNTADNLLSVRLSNIGHVNLLKKVNTPTGGTWEVSYERVGNTFELPQSKYVVNKIAIFDAFTADNNWSNDRNVTSVKYELPHHDRREREFFGFGKLTVYQHGGYNTALSPNLTAATLPEIYRYSVQEFHTNNYYLKGAVKKETLFDANHKKWTENKTTYGIYDSETPVSYLPFGSNSSSYNLSLIDENKVRFNNSDINNVTFPTFICTKFDHSRLFVTPLISVKSFTEGETGLITAVTVMEGFDNKGNITQYRDYGNQNANAYVSKIAYNPITIYGQQYNGYPSTIQVFDADGTTLKRERKAVYNTNGDLEKVITKLNTVDDTTVSMLYDTYGNLSKVTHENSINPVDNSKFFREYTYDDVVHTYPIAVNDAFGYASSSIYNYLFGIPVYTTDMNLQPMRTRIDDRGRPIEITGPYELFVEGVTGGSELGWTIRFEYQNEIPVAQKLTNENATIDDDNYTKIYNANNSFIAISPDNDNTNDPANKLHHALTRHFDPEYRADEESVATTNQILTSTLVDGFGKPVQVKKMFARHLAATTGNTPNTANNTIEWLLAGKVKQDAYGRAIESYYPTTQTDNFVGLTSNVSFVPTNAFVYDNTADTVEPTMATYDVLDRSKTTKLPGETEETTMAYTIDGDRFVTTVTNELGQVQKSFTDVRGRTTQTLQESVTGNIPTNFEYNNIGELLKVKDVAGNETISKYDLAGRRTELRHPDNGITQFVYDKASNLIERKTANLLQVNQKIEYKYTYNRLDEIKYPQNPENNVHYYYGTAGNSDAANDNAVGRLWYHVDATGTQYMKYGRLGELTLNRRSVAVPGDRVYWFQTEWTYDTWNRVKTIKYPDEELVTYKYNKGGELHAMTSNKNGANNKNIISQLGYDKFGQRTYLRYGNGTETTYNYQAERRRLDRMKVSASTTYGAATARQFVNNKYNYDVLSNVLSIQNNTVAVPTATQIGGRSWQEYTYDDLNRLTTASGNFVGRNDNGVGFNHSKYTLAMSYDSQHNITSKIQNHETATSTNANSVAGTWTQVEQTSYNLNYQDYNTADYSVAGYNYTQPHAPRTIVDQPNTTGCCDAANDPRVKTKAFEYDRNGNQTRITSKICTSTDPDVLRVNLWDEENRLRAIDLNPSSPLGGGGGLHPIAIYTYDAGGERIIKQNATSVAIYENALKVGTAVKNDFMLYPSGMLVARPAADGTGALSYTKHYFAGTQRVSSKIGTTTNLGKFLQEWTLIENSSGGAPINLVSTSGNQLTTAETGVTKVYTAFGITPTPTFASNNAFLAVPAFTGIAAETEHYFFHPDHLGSSNYITNFVGEVSQHMEYFAFGETFIEEHKNSHNSPYKFNGKELDEESGLYYYGARYLDMRTSIWLSVDPKATKFPSYSPYIYCFNNPLNLTDPDGREPVPWNIIRQFQGIKPSQWWTYQGVTVPSSFNKAALYNTKNLNAGAYQSVGQRNDYYAWAQSQADAKGYNSKWFGAAELVTNLNAVGATEVINLGIIKDNTEAFLKGGNKFLFSHNMKNAKDLLADGKLSGGFTDANGKKQSFEGLTGMALDSKMVEFEQSKVQEYINNYKENDLNSIIDNINNLFTGDIAKFFGPGDVNEVMKESFNGGKSFNFKNYADRVKLGQELIKKAHNE
jgi:RHS repeat-associated protein